VTYFKLSLRNARRQAGDYLIYFVTVILVCAMLYAFNGLIFSEEIHRLSGLLDSLTLIIILSSIVVVFIMGWLVSYTTGFMLSRRSRELGTYLLIGLENRQVVRLFSLENLAVGGVAFLCGIPLGNLIFQGLRAILLTMFSAPYRFTFKFSPSAAGLTFVYFTAVYFFALRRNRRRIRKMKIYDLIYFERQNEEEIVKKGGTRKMLFTVSLVLGVAGAVLLMLGEQIPGIIGAGCIIIFLYCFFISFSSGIPAFFERKPERKFKGQNLLIFRTLSAKLAAMGIVMATVSLLFTATLLTEGSGMVFHGIFEGRLERDSFDLLFVTDEKSHIDRYLKKMEEDIPLTGFVRYNLYQGTDGELVDYLEQTVGYLRYSYDDDYNKEVLMRYSDYAALRDLLGLPAARMEPGTYLIHCMPYLKETMSEWDRPLSVGEKTLLQGGIYTEQFGQSLWNGNGHQFLLVVPDEICENSRIIRYAAAAQTAKPLTEEQYNALDDAVDGAVDGVTSIVSEWDLLYSKSLNLTDTAAYSAIAVFPLFYLALTLAMTAATVLSIQQLSEALRYRTQFELLRKLGMDSREMRRALFWQTAVYYIMPVVPPVWIAVPFILNMCKGVEPGTMVGVSSPPVILTVTLGLFFLIYFIYIVIASAAMKRNVLPE